jgi:mono/diheme cytochrome c family protein
MRIVLLALSIVALAVIACVEEVSAQAMEFGKGEYLRSCSSCHGSSGKGDGPVVKSLTKKPADLTKLAENNQGVFPVARVYDVIDGRVQVMIHGTREMPIWGDIYTRELSARMPRDFMSKELADAMVRVRILMLIEYISTLQGK